MHLYSDGLKVTKVLPNYLGILRAYCLGTKVLVIHEATYVEMIGI